MKFLADVNIPSSSINLFKKLGHQVIDIKKDGGTLIGLCPRDWMTLEPIFCKAECESPEHRR